MTDRQTLVYKSVGGCDIRCDVFGAAPGADKPAVMWIHGGGLIFGTRATPRPAWLAALLAAGAVVVSVDHRLAPQTQLAEIAGDVLDAWRWMAERGPALLGIDPARMAVAGGSAGAYLSLIIGLRAPSPPRAIVSFWGFGDITEPWEAEPSAYYLSGDLVSRDDAWASVPGTAAVSEGSTPVSRSTFYLYCRQQGRWLQEVTGHDPKESPRWFDDWCPVRQIDAAFPPTMLVHGRDDTDVPWEQSRDLAGRLREAGVEHELIVVDGAGHGLAGAAPERVAELESRAAAFLLARL